MFSNRYVRQIDEVRSVNKVNNYHNGKTKTNR